MTEYVINDLLCFICSSSESKSKQDILNECLSYYSEEQIKDAKEILHNCLKIKPKWRRGKNENRDNCSDIVEIICNFAPNDDSMPVFVTNNHKAFPPSFGYELLQNAIANMVNKFLS